ncbi:MAG: hypothetical protein WDO73_29960 [Ignavibacteriota bacterium]
MHKAASADNPADLDPALQHFRQVIAINPELDQAKFAQKNIVNIQKAAGTVVVSERRFSRTITSHIKRECPVLVEDATRVDIAPAHNSATNPPHVESREVKRRHASISHRRTFAYNHSPRLKRVAIPRLPRSHTAPMSQLDTHPLRSARVKRDLPSRSLKLRHAPLSHRTTFSRTITARVKRELPSAFSKYLARLCQARRVHCRDALRP